MEWNQSQSDDAKSRDMPGAGLLGPTAPSKPNANSIPAQLGRRQFIQQRLAVEVAFHILQQNRPHPLDEIRAVVGPRDVRRQDGIWTRPQRMIGWEWKRIMCIDRDAGNPALFQGPDKGVFFDQMTSCRIENVGC